MANPISEAFMSAISQSMDPNHALVRDYSKTFVAQQTQELIRQKLETIEIVQQKLASAKENDAPASVIHAYEKTLMLALGS